VEAGRTRWTDERIDDLAFEIRALRAEMRDGFRELREEMRDGFRGLRTEVAEVRGEAGFNRRLLMGMWTTTLLGFAGLIVEAGLR
jgi:hypothetical protein